LPAGEVDLVEIVIQEYPVQIWRLHRHLVIRRERAGKPAYVEFERIKPEELPSGCGIPKAFERNYLASPVVFPQPAGSAG